MHMRIIRANAMMRVIGKTRVDIHSEEWHVGIVRKHYCLARLTQKGVSTSNARRKYTAGGDTREVRQVRQVRQDA